MMHADDGYSEIDPIEFPPALTFGVAERARSSAETHEDNEALMAAIVQAGLDTVDGAFAYRDGEDLRKPGLGHRRRTKVELEDEEGELHRMFLKRYGREGLGLRIRRLWTHGRLISPGVAEFANIRAVQDAGLPTMHALACGQDAAGGRSFVLVSAVEGASLEVRAEDYYLRHVDDEKALMRFTDALAGLVRDFHEAGFVHRDLYACHIFLDERGGRLELALIDLARVFAPRVRRFRWRVKDLAQLKYSMPPHWVERCWRRFMAAYFGSASQGRRWRRYRRAIDRRVRRMQRRSGRAEGWRMDAGSDS